MLFILWAMYARWGCPPLRITTIRAILLEALIS